ncbi:lanthionine synthetase LanC family protein [Lactobacillus taiwanensis]|uniref:class III lanthionine synthetase LanKC N-terminal domain-containing protein n=1 Tax=Lactobacillus taiwanensis TaxID=508451 RepID=UPI00129D2D1D|nr:lanthionine synthetase LanC family protein [Lactobacillus taiwanensis]MRM98310.1 hypothetical protein [Lactobacillus taiwanensis]
MKQIDIYKEYIDILPDNVNVEDLSKLTRDKNHVFLQFNFSEYELPDQGFKIHISVNLVNYQKILNIIFAFCRSNRITFKYISNYSILEKNIAGKSQDIFSGKFITIYPNTFNYFKKYIEDLYKVEQLKTKSSIFIITDRRYKDSNNIFYRYGAIGRNDGYILAPNGQKIKDNRSIGYKLPKFIDEPFPNNYDDNLKGKYIFKKYIPEKGLNFKSSGSVFDVRRIQDNKIYIMKNAKVGFSDDCNSEIKLLKKEKDNLIRLNKTGITFIPKYIDSFYEDKDYFLIETKAVGENGDEFRASIENNFMDKNLRERTITKYNIVILDLLNKVEKLHHYNIYIGDLSTRNIVINKHNKVCFIDLPQLTFLNDETLTSHYRAKDFSDDETPFLSSIEQDNRQLGYLILALFCRSNMFLLLDNSGKTTLRFFEKYAQEFKIPNVFVEIIRQLLSKRITDLNPLISMLEDANLNECYECRMPNLLSLSSLKQKLLKTSQCMNIEHINWKKKDIYPRNAEDEDLILLRQIQEKIYLDKKISKNERIKVYQYLKNKKYVQLQYLEDWITISTCYISVCKLAEVDMATYILKNLFNKFSKRVNTLDNEEKIYFKMEEGVNRFSPYLANGTAGVLMILLIYKQKFNSSYWEDEIQKSIKLLKESKMPKAGGMYYGLAGIIYSLIIYNKIYKNKNLNYVIRTMLTNLQFYTLDVGTNLFLIDGTFADINVNFSDGNMGLIKVIEMTERLDI